MQTHFFSGASKALRVPNFCGSGHDCAVPTEPPEIPLKHHNTKARGLQAQVGDVFESNSNV